MRLSITLVFNTKNANIIFYRRFYRRNISTLLGDLNAKIGGKSARCLYDSSGERSVAQSLGAGLSVVRERCASPCRWAGKRGIAQYCGSGLCRNVKAGEGGFGFREICLYLCREDGGSPGKCGSLRPCFVPFGGAFPPCGANFK